MPSYAPSNAPRTWKPAETPPANRELCVYCWPRFLRADVWDEHGYACCNACRLKPDRVRLMPAFLFESP